MGTTIDDVEINILYKECESVGNKISSLIMSGEKYLSMGFTVIATAAAYGIKEKIQDILIILPYAIFTVMFYSLHIFTEVMSMGGYKCYLEELINIKMNKKLLLWENEIAKRRHATDDPLFLYFIYVVFLILSIINSLHISYTQYSKITFFAIFIGNIILSIGLIIETRKLKKSFQRTYEYSKQSSSNVI